MDATTRLPFIVFRVDAGVWTVAPPPATEPRSTLAQPLAAAMAQIHSTGVPLNTAYGQVDGVDGRWGWR